MTRPPYEKPKTPLVIYGDDDTWPHWAIADADGHPILGVDMSDSKYFSWQAKAFLEDLVLTYNANNK